MTDKPSEKQADLSADWLMRGALARVGDKIDRLTGRRWTPSSSLATSQLIDRLKKLLDAESRSVEGKGMVVPHHITLKVQWDKFSADSDDGLQRLETELLIAAADHINDSLYYTFAPLTIKVAPDYFTEGVKLFVSFEKFVDQAPEAEMNVTMPVMSMPSEEAQLPQLLQDQTDHLIYIARFRIQDVEKETKLDFGSSGRLTVGRTGACDLLLDDNSVSKVHASLAANDNGFFIADTGSTNGTFVNDMRISYGKAVRVAADDRIRFGSVEVLLAQVKTDHLNTGFNSVDETVIIDGLEFSRGSGTRGEDRDKQNAGASSDETLEMDSEDQGS